MSQDKAATIAVRAGINTDQHHSAVVPPIHLSSTYRLEGYNQKGDYDYSRSGNPTRSSLGTAIADLEGGCTGIITSTGMAAIHLICQLLNKDDLLVIPHDCYGGSYRLFTHLQQRGLFKLAVVDQTDIAQVEAVMQKNPRLTLIETPSNPLLRIVDITKICELAKKAGSLVAVDNTFLTPILQKPLALGADIVIHSTTKFINGHSDVVAGAVVTKELQLGEELAWWANCIGITGSPFDSFLTLRGLKTLPVRLKQHQENAQSIVAAVASHKAVANVYYPGLKEHPGHQLAAQQQAGFGSMLSIELNGGLDAVKSLFEHLSLFTLAQSLGGVESLISHPSTMTHAGMDLEAQLVAGIKPGLVRLSVGIEDVDDLLKDLTSALDNCLAITES
ncbi:cystathionine gamma-synthase [Thalassotalea litorea]|uniref:Cystathionine gamma-synthase n=1 Tax=Thalassotalea litorea TaxID=2020715 RepID=A0A5R9IIE1_9GAMM|nr:cystathionine gamma-synthase [Thalassotalea litorea]TLU61077.1 cystathionine gamma-synthase [Thalassotalea litorea]